MDNAAPAWPGDRGGHVWPKDREVATEDGPRIRYTVLSADRDLPWLVLCPGFMCPDNFWATLGPALAEHNRVIVLNYRSMGASTDPRPPGYRARHLSSADYTIERFASDVQAVLEAEGAEDVAVVGHSMGCQVGLQLWRQAPELVGSLSLITGPYASPLHTFYGSKLGTHLFPFAYFGVPLLPRPVQRAITKLPRLPMAIQVARLLRALGPLTPDDGMDLYFQHFGEVDPLVALKIVRGMHEFDAGPWLAEVTAPTLILVGGRDTFCPPEVGEAMLAVLPEAELGVMPEATHGAPIEFPLEIADRIADFLARRAGRPEVRAVGRPGCISPPRAVSRPARMA
ncbi:alpha/beta fold hydrolase [Nitriliruptor alkaliphilus]|uniref:alpha/beta fold hydrolase n=1 Tax=Nitriliruptor alkaliphilus TaxID=427918 RepID=UPI000695E0E6|nr:alpha/beta hydrolase [Nitriliruptor alkaliphilus]